MPERRARAMLAGTLASLVAVTVTGCTEGSAAPPPVQAESMPASVTPSQSPTGPPPMPDKARGSSRKAAVAFVRHWVDTLNYSADTGSTDSAPLEALSSPGCDACGADSRFH